MKNFWLVKQEPSSYSWSDFVAEGQTSWTGVRNYAARNNLRRMRKGDEVLFYHSGEEKAVVGIAKVTGTDLEGRGLVCCRSCPNQATATASHSAGDQSQCAIETNSVSPAIAFVGYAFGRGGVSRHRKVERTLVV
jgi:hypothetical protein